MADQNVLDLLLLIKLIVDRQHRAAGIAENVLDPMVDQRLHDHFRPGHFARAGGALGRSLVFCLGLGCGVHCAFSVLSGALAEIAGA